MQVVQLDRVMMISGQRIFNRLFCRSVIREQRFKMAEEVTLALVGDLMMGRLVDAALSRHGLRHVWGNFQPLLSGGLGKNQLVAGNLECASMSNLAVSVE